MGEWKVWSWNNPSRWSDEEHIIPGHWSEECRTWSMDRAVLFGNALKQEHPHLHVHVGVEHPTHRPVSEIIILPVSERYTFAPAAQDLERGG